MHTCCAQPTGVLGTLTLSWPPEPLPPRPPRPPTTKQLKGWCQDEGGSGTLLQPHIDDQACPDGMYACECPGLLKQRPAHWVTYTTEMCSPTVLEARVGDQVSAGWFLLALRRLCSLSQACGSAGNLCSSACGSSTPLLHLHMYMSVCVQMSPFYNDTSHIG